MFKKTFILLDVSVCSIAEYFYELCCILRSPLELWKWQKQQRRCERFDKEKSRFLMRARSLRIQHCVAMSILFSRLVNWMKSGRGDNVAFLNLSLKQNFQWFPLTGSFLKHKRSQPLEHVQVLWSKNIATPWDNCTLFARFLYSTERSCINIYSYQFVNWDKFRLSFSHCFVTLLFHNFKILCFLRTQLCDGFANQKVWLRFLLQQRQRKEKRVIDQTEEVFEMPCLFGFHVKRWKGTLLL